MANTALQTTTARLLPTVADPVPTVTNKRLYASLLAAGYLPDRMASHGITEATLPELRLLRDELKSIARPAPPMEVALVVERLLNHYPRADLSDGGREARLEDWYDDMAEIPADALKAAARDYRRSSARFAPTPGQIIELAKKYGEAPRVGVIYAERTIAVLEDQAGR